MTFGSTFGRVLSPTFQPKSQAAGGWKPKDISDCVLWLDFSDADYMFTDAGSTKVLSDGDAIYQINDKSGSGYHLTQSTLEKRPLYKTNVQNSRSVARFDGSDDWMSVNFTALSQPNTIFIVYKSINAENDETYLVDSVLTNRHAILSSTYSFPDTFYLYAGDHYRKGTFTKNSYTIICAQFNTTDSELWENTNSFGTGSVGTMSLAGIIIGAKQNVFTSNLDGDYCELVVYNKVLSGEERGNAFAYLNNKWAVYS